MKAGKYLVAFLILALVLIPSIALASSEYAPDAEGTLYAEVLDAAGDPVNDATVSLDLMDSDGNLELDGVSMTYIAGSDGIYKYDFTAPSDEGTYIAVATCTEGQSTTEVQVVSPSGSAGDIWGEAIVGYTDTTTFGGLINDILGGGAMLFVLGALGLGLIIAFFWKKSGVLAYGAAGAWLLLGFRALEISGSSTLIPIDDTYIGLFWLCMAFTIACALLPSVMREKPSKDDIYPEEVDEVTGEKIEKEEPKAKKSRSRVGRLFDRSGQL